MFVVAWVDFAQEIHPHTKKYSTSISNITSSKNDNDSVNAYLHKLKESMNKLKVVGVIIDNEEMPSVQQYGTQGITKSTTFFVQQYAQCVIDRLLMSYMSYFRQRRNILEFRNANEYPK